MIKKWMVVSSVVGSLLIQFEALVECAAFVNWRMVVAGGTPLVTLAFNV